LEDLRALDAAVRADDRVARAHHDARVGVDGTRAVLQLADEAVVQAVEALLLRVGEVEVGREEAPGREREVAHPADLDRAEPTHELRRPSARQTVRQQEVEVVPEGSERGDGHAPQPRSVARRGDADAVKIRPPGAASPYMWKGSRRGARRSRLANGKSTL